MEGQFIYQGDSEVKYMKNRNIVFSTDSNFRNEEHSGDSHTTNNKDQAAYIERDRKSRGGKTVTVISNLKGDLKALKKELQKLCGSGGSAKNNTIEIQGDFREKIGDYLQSKNIKIKYRGG
jgi:translation initiation factor 1